MYYVVVLERLGKPSVSGMAWVILQPPMYDRPGPKNISRMSAAERGWEVQGDKARKAEN